MRLSHIFLYSEEENIPLFMDSIKRLQIISLIRNDINNISLAIENVQEFLLKHLNDSDLHEKKSRKIDTFSELMKFFSQNQKIIEPNPSIHFTLSEEIAQKIGLNSQLQMRPITVDLPQKKLRFVLSQFIYSHSIKQPEESSQFLTISDAIKLTLQNVVGLVIIQFFTNEEKNRCFEEIRGYLIRNIDSIVKEYLFGTAFPKIKLKYKIEREIQYSKYDIKLIIQKENRETEIYAKIVDNKENGTILYLLWSTTPEYLEFF